MSSATVPVSGSRLDRALRVFGDVRAGEGRDALLMFVNIFLLLSATTSSRRCASR